MIRGLKKSVALHFMNEPEDPYRIAMSLTKSKSHIVTRLTGGCGSLTSDAAKGMVETISSAFLGYTGVMLFGGTRMIERNDESIVVPGITEIAPLVRVNNKQALVLGVIPRTDELFIQQNGTFIVAQEAQDVNFKTIVHPDQDMCIVVQADINKASKWMAEVNVCLKITSLLLAVDGWRSLLVSYAGGGVTRQEIEKTASLKWPVLLIEGGGGSTDLLAQDNEFRRNNPSVHSVAKEVSVIRFKLKEMGALGRRASNVVARENRASFKIFSGKEKKYA